MMGYMPVSGTLLAKEKEVNVVLKEDVMHLNGVVVTGSRTERPVKLSPITTASVGRKGTCRCWIQRLTTRITTRNARNEHSKVGLAMKSRCKG